AGGALRAACRRVAIGIAKGAVCGTTRVACGRYAPSSKRPISCQPRPPARCADGARFQSAACTNETYCADAVDWTAATCVDVRRDGHFVPGAGTVTFTKPSAATYCTGGSGDCATTPRGPGCLCSANADCASGVCETQTRTLATTVWYPAPPGSG